MVSLCRSVLEKETTIIIALVIHSLRYHPSKQGEAVADAMPTAECHDTDVEEDIDGLLEWTHSLNYDE